jgi:hypothetical protein
MSYDEEALKAKKIELAALAEHAVEELTTDKVLLARLVVEAFAELSPPETPHIHGCCKCRICQSLIGRYHFSPQAYL